MAFDTLTAGPVEVVSGAAAIATSSGETACAIIEGGEVLWGRGLEGQLGDGVSRDSATPVAVSELPPDVVQVGVGVHYGCARAASGEVWCWGGSEEDPCLPSQLPCSVGNAIVDLSVGSSSVCVVLACDELRCLDYSAAPGEDGLIDLACG
ncbi:MAG: hypothetical protein R3A79_29480 [Nannocystaceae bacterium]